MIYLQTIVALNSSAILLLLIVFLNLRVTIHNNSPDNRLFFIMAVTTIAQAVIETVSFFIEGASFFGAYWLNVIINDLLFINNAVFSYLWVLYVDSKLFENFKLRRIRHLVMGIPAMIIIALSLVNLFVPVFFMVSKETLAYSRTDIYFIPMLSITFYFFYGLFLTFRYRSQNEKNLFFPALIFLVPIVAAAVVEFLFYGLNVLWIGSAISLTSIYINLQNQASYIDSLSGLFTRQYLIYYLRTEMKKNYIDKKLAGIMLDIDKFKSINDTYGHLAGDEAIREAGRILQASLPYGAHAFRFGGDEFMVLQKVKNEKQILDTVSRIRSEAGKFNDHQGGSYRINFSIGSALCNQGDTLDEFLEKMDVTMYAEKNRKKSLTSSLR